MWVELHALGLGMIFISMIQLLSYVTSIQSSHISTMMGVCKYCKSYICRYCVLQWTIRLFWIWYTIYIYAISSFVLLIVCFFVRTTPWHMKMGCLLDSEFSLYYPWSKTELNAAPKTHTDVCFFSVADEKEQAGEVERQEGWQEVRQEARR